MKQFFGRLALLALPVLTACAPQAYLVRQPEPSGLRAEGTPPAAETIKMEDQRKGADRDFSTGTLPATLRTDAGPIDPPAYLATALQAELASRGLPVRVASGSAPGGIKLHTFRVLNHRSSGFSPFVTLTFLAADIETPTGTQRVAAFVRRGKVPVWSFDEVIEPTFNQPMSIAVKELASKIAARRYGYRGQESQVDALIKKLSAPRGPEAFLDVHALGTLHHPKAIGFLGSLLQDGDEYVRAAAMSSLGMLRAHDQLPRFKAIYQGREAQWADRAMALKAIGDLGSPEARAFLEQELKHWESKGSDKEALWTAQVIRLFI
ncbi:HEAT repeat domain-containing protein [Inhella gelatinilytica]|uniref:HEAT repeat domain-containing protein n=1 Tax=Inhella gelatinilytica TaxID=2795030 RepID=A0A931IZS6_9BURK|nr:HEAT repeat domain-containing protein [Inhella gelatinilytica]MBH9553573.1 HEAT repeat domain-containing protein [Inhella gelatinilytica]